MTHTWKHYLSVDAAGRILYGWSSGPRPERETAGAVCLREDGGYQFRLRPDGEENPVLETPDGIPLYKWNGTEAVTRTEAEIAADRALLPSPPPSPTERLDALEAAIERGLRL